jgi:hypothetical protein
VIDTHIPIIKTDGGPWAMHDMACAVCHINPAVLDLNTGIFQPCWSCFESFSLVKKKKWGFRR